MKKEKLKQSFSKSAKVFSLSLKLTKLIFNLEGLLFFTAAIATILGSLIPFINIYIYKLIIDIVVASISGKPLDHNLLYIIFGTRIVTYFLQDASWRTQEYLDRLIWTKIPIHLDEIIFNKISNLDMQYFESGEFKTLLQKVKDSYNYTPQRTISSLIYTLQSIVQVIFAFFALATLNWVLLIIIFIAAIPEFINQAKQSEMSWGVWSYNAPSRKKYWYLSELLQDPSSLKEMRIFGLTKNFIKEIKDVDVKFYKENKILLIRNYLLGMILSITNTFLFVGVEIYVVLQALAKAITIGDISFYTGVIFNFQTGISGFFRNLTNVFENALYVESIFELLEVKPLIKLTENPIKLNLNTAPTIEFKNVTFSYPNTKVKVLNNFSLLINPKEKIALVGENGAGKTTIIKLLARFYDVNEGEILINGVNIKEIDLKTWYKYLGVLFQDFNRYQDLVKNNIAFGNVEKQANPEEIKNAAESAGAGRLIEKLDKQYKQMLGATFEDAKDLSTGQWQKIALARAFFRDCEVLVLDEPTASMDARAEAEIFERVEKLSKHKSVIIISHRFSTVRYADRIIVLDKGKITEQGNHDELLKQNGIYADLFNLQAKGYK